MGRSGARAALTVPRRLGSGTGMNAEAPRTASLCKAGAPRLASRVLTGAEAAETTQAPSAVPGPGARFLGGRFRSDACHNAYDDHDNHPT